MCIYEKQEFLDPAGNLNLIGSTFSENYRRALAVEDHADGVGVGHACVE